jgi:hemerythrin-like domain-containing protein
MQTQTRPTEILSSEHRVIERVLECVDVLARRARKDGTLDADAAEKALEVLGTFADTCHHMKEENVLFVRMQERGIPRHVGPLAVMLEDHEGGRAFVRAMRAALARYVKGERAAAHDFAENAFGYTELLREHIGKEDHVLFPMAEACFSDADRAEVLAAFAQAESKDLGAGTHERMLALVDGLTDKLGVSREARPAQPFTGCGHGHAPSGGAGGCGHHK